MVPLIVFVVVPFLEFTLPFFLKVGEGVGVGVGVGESVGYGWIDVVWQVTRIFSSSLHPFSVLPPTPSVHV